MKKTKKLQRISSLLLTSALSLCALAAPLRPASAADNSDLSKAPAQGVNWTKIQDLDPNAKSKNTPIKQKWAVVIGASKYKESRLDTADSKMDLAARSFGEFLKDPNSGRFPDSHVKTLINSEATRQNVLANLGKGWLGSLAGADDLVVVYIATQAFPTTDGGSYLCAYDCALDNPYSTCFSMKTLMETLRQEVKTNRIILIIEAPYSGAAELRSGAKALPGEKFKTEEPVALGSGYMIISSSKPDQETKGCLFSRNLIAALKANNGLISIDQAFLEARAKTEADTIDRGKQTPQLKSDWNGNPAVLGAASSEKVKDIPANVQTFVAAEAHYLKANNFVAAGDFDNAIAEYQAAIQTDNTYADAVGDYGAVLSIKGDWAGALDKYKAAIALSPRDALFHANYARVLSKLGKVDESDRELEQAYALDPKNKIIIMALAGRCVAASNFDSAIKILDQAALLFPDSAAVQDRLSNAYAKSNNLAQALSHAKLAVKLDPKSIASKLNLGSCLFLKGDLVSAEAAYMEASSLDPQNADAHYLLAGIMETLGDHAGAKVELDQFVKLAPPADARVSKAREKLTTL
jgi:Flp pilus assembly protein TadD